MIMTLNGQWHDEQCRHRRPYICEKEFAIKPTNKPQNKPLNRPTKPTKPTRPTRPMRPMERKFNVTRMQVCAKEWAKNDYCHCNGTVVYGSFNSIMKNNPARLSARNSTSKIRCNNRVFGDPVHGIVKSCFCIGQMQTASECKKTEKFDRKYKRCEAKRQYRPKPKPTPKRTPLSKPTNSKCQKKGCNRMQKFDTDDCKCISWIDWARKQALKFAKTKQGKALIERAKKMAEKNKKAKKSVAKILVIVKSKAKNFDWKKLANQRVKATKEATEKMNKMKTTANDAIKRAKKILGKKNWSWTNKLGFSSRK